MSGCYYATWAGAAFGWTQVFPSIVTLMLSAVGLLTSQIMFLFFGLYLHAMQYELWVFQSYFQSQRPNPVCQLYHAYAFPSIEAYYAGAVVTAFIMYGYMWDIPHGVIAWLFFYVIAAFPLIMVWFGYNVWWEVLLSLGMGVVFTALFVIVLKLYISPAMPYILNEIPATWLGYKDTYLMDEDLQVECQNVTNVVHS